MLRAPALADYPGFRAGGDELTWLALDGLRIESADAARRQKLALAPGWVPAVGEGIKVVRAGRVFDDLAGQWREQLDIVIGQGRILALQPWGEHALGITLIDASGLAVLPGLIDSHAHHQGHDGEWIGRAWLGFGVTSVVEPGGLPRESRELAEAWDSGRRPGPRLFFAGPQIDGTRRYFPFAIHAAGRERQQLEFQRADALGYRLLKSYIRLPHEDQRWLIGQAQQRGIQLTSHELYPAVALGAGRVEHLRGTSRFGRSTKQSDWLRSYHDVATLLGATNTAIMPSVAAYGGFISYLLDHPELDKHPQYAALYPAEARRALRALGMLAGRREPLLRESLANAQAGILAMHQSGAIILAGTDSPIFPYGLSLVVELANYQAAGLAPAEALRAATSAPAAAIGLGNELGRIAPGYIADLIVVDGDPLEDVSALLGLRGVMRGGRWWPVEALREPPAR
ncbi:MAG: amidohydrolase family protein [Chromatiales bacterium]|nr:amidohydrolase family protein [Chromatiales bacterium]